MKVIEKYFPVVRFIMPSRVVLTFGSVDEILKCKVISLLELKLLRAMRNLGHEKNSQHVFIKSDI